MIMNLPWIYITLKYDEINIYNYLAVKSILPIDILNASFLILTFQMTIAICYFAFGYLRLQLPLSKLKTFSLFENYKSIMILLMLSISYSSKYYLVYTGAWFMFEEVDVSSNPLIGIAFLLEKFDLLVGLYVSYLHNTGRMSRKYWLLLLAVITISVSFALISTSKERIIIMFLPVFLMVFSSNKKVIGMVVILLLLPLLSHFFDYMKYIRYDHDDILYSTKQFLKEPSYDEYETIFDNSVLIRLDYHSIIAIVINRLEIVPNEFKFDYLNNFIGIIPRALWPNKPQISKDMNLVARELGVIHSNNYNTSVGLTPLGMSYYQMGLLGVFFIAPFISFFLAFFAQNLSGNSWVEYLLSFMIALALARNGTYINIVPTLIQISAVFYMASSLLNSNNFSNVSGVKA